MAKIFEFPVTPRFQEASRHWRVLRALRFLFRKLRGTTPAPKALFVVYKLEDSESVFYLNVDFELDELRQAIDDSLEDARRRQMFHGLD
jgi:hypothetical protein